ncbi:hypothetical protein DPMN_099787 [Dreissena polymorpha]|uniref:Uncharacterized protein n=1 Tax=Dreissena polymorpha TaxID=45954 RepID=A0A9D4LFI9_DREPO|nr:hypothetical protein DPMN_099787 [Dreissena polymorpha]
MTPIWLALAPALAVLMTSYNGVHAQVIKDAERLFSNLMVDYNKMFRPVLNQSKPVVVSTWLDLVSIQDFNEVEEKISFTAILFLTWTDERLGWDPEKYGGINNINIDVSKIWAPQVMLLNNVLKIERLSEDWHTVSVNASGSCLYFIANVFTSSCDVDVTFYPWDTQTCAFQFMPAKYEPGKIVLWPLKGNVDFNYYSPNGAWDLVNTSVSSEIYGYTVSFKIEVERKPQFAIVNVILPLIIMSALNILVFLIPTDCGERISFCLTVLLSIAVFLTLVGDNLPKNSRPMSVFSYYLVSVLIISVAISLAVICSLHTYHRGEKQHPGAAWRAVARRLGCYCARRSGPEKAYRVTGIPGVDYKLAWPENVTPRASLGMHLVPYPMRNHRGVFLNRNTHVNGTLSSDHSEDSTFHEEETHEGDSSVMEIKWSEVSIALDKVFFVFFSLILTTDTLCFFMVIYNNVTL